jgi:ankyrin repeat protein
MDKTFNKNPQQPYIPRGSTIYKPVIPEKKPSDDLVNLLFLSIADGNYFKIKEFLFNNNMIMTSKNATGESALHVIIKNSNITPVEKKELVQLAIIKGAQVNAYDVNNISPLHLACKYQLVDTVQLLLSYGANVSALDNQYKSVMHYAIVGENIECPNIEKEKVKALIPTNSTVIKINKADNDPIIKELNESINDFLFQDKDTSKFISQIKNSMKELNNMFPFEIKNQLEKNKQDIIDVLLNSSASDADKKKEVFEKIMDMKTSLSEFIGSCIKNAVDPIPIKSNISNGWGPDNLQENRLLQILSLQEYLDDIRKNVGSNNSKKMIELQGLIGTLEKEINKLDDFNKTCDNVIGFSHIYSKAIGRQLRRNDIYNMTNLSDILFYELDNDNYTIFEVPIICFGTTIPPIAVSIKYNLLTGEFTDSNNIQVRGFPNMKFNLERTINPYQYRLNSSYIDNYRKEFGSEPNKVKLSNEYPMEVGGDVVIDPVNIIKVKPIVYNRIETTRGLFFNSKLKMYCRFLNSSYSLLKPILKNIMDNLDTEKNLSNTYDKLIPAAIIQLLNITLLLASIIGEYAIVQSKLSSMYQYFKSLEPLFVGNDNLYFLHEQITYETDSIQKKTRDIEKYCDGIYASVKSIADNLNGQISLIEMRSSSKCIIEYFKYGSFADFYASNTTREINDIVNKPLQKITEFPPDYNFVFSSGKSITDKKKALIEHFIPQITLLNSAQQINTRIATPETLSTIGYLFGTGIVDTRPLLINPLTGVQETLFLKESGRNPTIANDPTIQLIGKMGYQYSTQINKSDFVYPIIGVFYSTFLKVLKYAIIRYIIQKSYDYIATGEVPITTSGQNIQKILINLNSNVKNVVKFSDTDYGFILTLVGRYVDKILSNIINDFAITQTNEILLQTMRTVIPVHYTDLITNIFPTIINTIIPVVDNGINFKLNEIFDDIMILYQSNSTYIPDPTEITVFDRELALMSIGNLHENYDKTKKIHKITNFDSSTQTQNSICYKYDSDVINLLLKYNCSVNLKDGLGNTPLYYAIDTGNILAIQLLKQNGAVVHSTTSKNKMGNSALEYLWHLYEIQLGKQIGNKFDVCNNLTKKLIHNLKKNERYSNNVPKHTSLILPMTLYLLNHQLYLVGKGYSNGWSFSDNSLFESTIGLNVDSTLPLLDTEFTESDVSMFETPIAYVESTNTKIKEKQDFIDKGYYTIANLTQELNMLNAKPVRKQHDDLRITQIDDLIRQIQHKIDAFELEIITFNDQVQQTNGFKQNKFTGIKQFINANKGNIILSDSVIDIYDSVFKDVINSDLTSLITKKVFYYSTDVKTYPLLWNKLFHNINTIDYTQVIDRIVDYQQSVLNDSSKPILDKVKNLSILSRYYSKIINPFCDNYFELEQTYNETNYPMTKIIDIIVHVIKHTICVNLFGFIVKALTKFILNIIPPDNDTNKFGDKSKYAYMITQLVIEILDTNHVDGEGSPLMQYIFEVMPLKLVKSVLQIYEGPNEGEDDLDRKNTPESLFAFINKILESATTVGLKDKSSLLMNFKEYVYPFYIDYSVTFIKEMKKLIDSYLRQLQGEFNLLNMSNELLQ